MRVGSRRTSFVGGAHDDNRDRRYAAEWFGVATRQMVPSDEVVVDREGSREFRAPFTKGPAVLYLRRTDR
jgi:hypothetical protein